MSSIDPQPNVPAPPPPPGWPAMPPPKKAGLPAWAIVVIVVVVVVVVLVSIVAAAILFLLATPIDGPSSRPQITFSQAGAVTNGFQFEVAGISQRLPVATYRVALSMNGTTVGSARTLSASMSFGDFTITWTDLGGEGDLTGGDVFRVTHTGGLPMNSDYVVSVLWIDGSACGSREYAS